MTKPPLATAITALMGVMVPASIIMPAFAGDTTGSRPTRVSSSTDTVVERELAKRHELLKRGEQHLENGDRAMRARDFEKAYAEYKAACDAIPNSANTAALYSRALRSLCNAGVALAEQRIAEGRYQDAEVILKTVVSEQYDPHCRRAIEVLAHLEEPDYYNKTITPKFRANVEQVKQWFVEAKGFMDSGRWDLAYKRCDQILGVDPYNVAARNMQEQIDRNRDNFAIQQYNQTRGHMIWQLDNEWGVPVRRYDVKSGPVVDTQTVVGRSQIIQRKLASIILPRLEFREATIREAIDYLKKKSQELDPTHEGVNIVLKIDAGAEAPAAPVAAAPAAPVIPGLEPVPGAAPAPAPLAAAAPVVNPSEARITVSLTNIPLGEALKYVTSLANLKFKVEDYAISVVPLSTPTETLLNREWKVPPNLFSGPGAVAGSGGLEAPAVGAGGATAGAARDATRGGSGIAQRVDAKDFLSASGVTFPPGSSAIYLASSSKLIVKNTQENIDLIDAIVEAARQQQPAQVEIESKFVEIQQDNLKELGFDWLVGQGAIPGNSKVFFSGGTTGTASGVNAANFPFPVGSGQNQTFPVTQGLRTGSFAISQNAIDALLAGSAGTAAASPAIAALSGVFTDPQFQVVLHALNQKKGIDLLSAPRVSTKSGQRAVIEIIREFRYPTEFEPPQIPQTFGNQGNNATGVNPITGAILGGGGSSSFPVTPTTPTAFETRNTGVTLEVEPIIGPDGMTIELNLVPQVVEFEGFINYGSPIQTTSTNPLTGATTTNIITPNVINQPIFSTRKVTTSVSVYDGSTVVLGGLMREDVQKTEDKIPIIGDLPVVGRLFRSQAEQHLKTNLVIFVSARLFNPAGDLIHPGEEAEEVVTTLPTPEVTEPPLPLMTK